MERTHKKKSDIKTVAELKEQMTSCYFICPSFDSYESNVPNVYTFYEDSHIFVVESGCLVELDPEDQQRMLVMNASEVFITVLSTEES